MRGRWKDFGGSSLRETSSTTRSVSSNSAWSWIWNCSPSPDDAFRYHYNDEIEAQSLEWYVPDDGHLLPLGAISRDSMIACFCDYQHAKSFWLKFLERCKRRFCGLWCCDVGIVHAAKFQVLLEMIMWHTSGCKQRLAGPAFHFTIAIFCRISWYIRGSEGSLWVFWNEWPVSLCRCCCSSFPSITITPF